MHFSSPKEKNLLSRTLLVTALYQCVQVVVFPSQLARKIIVCFSLSLTTVDHITSLTPFIPTNQSIFCSRDYTIEQCVKCVRESRHCDCAMY